MGEVPAGRIFISYRRADTPHVAGRLFDRLEARFGAGNVFMDVDSIEPGLDFAVTIEEADGSCDVLLALIGPHWVDAVDEHGRHRLDDPVDFVKLEIAAALRRQIRVIPVLVDGAPSLRRRDLPEALATLDRRQSVRLEHASFGAGVAMLIVALERALRARVADPQDQPQPKTTGPAPGRDSRPGNGGRSGISASVPDTADVEQAAPDAGGTARLEQIYVPSVGSGAGDAVQMPIAATEAAVPSPSSAAQDSSSAAGGVFFATAPGGDGTIGLQLPGVGPLRRPPRLTEHHRRYRGRSQPQHHSQRRHPYRHQGRRYPHPYRHQGRRYPGGAVG